VKRWKQISKALLGPDSFLFFDGFVVKGAEAGMKLAWHQDSGYVNAVDGDIEHKPYITCWCPLDDVTEENGTVYILPMSESGIKPGFATYSTHHPTIRSVTLDRLKERQWSPKPVA
jgi:ectoine hydroxylase-related dioxygenase (phytanoyl-CoA dioxygenase family)